MMSDVEEQCTETFPFQVKDCALVTLATGFRAQNLREFRDSLLRVPGGSIYHHFWGRFLEPYFDEPEYNNDFAAWVYHGLHEKALAERLSVIDPTDYEDIEALRRDVLDRVEDRLDENEFVPWARADKQFHFIRSQIVVLDAGKRIEHPRELGPVIGAMSLGGIFYHFIDARKRTEGATDDFSAWLACWGEEFENLRHSVISIDPYFSSLKGLRSMLATLFGEYFGGEEA